MFDYSYHLKRIIPHSIRHRLKLVLALVSKPKKYNIEIWRIADTNICNARCIFCSYPQAKMEPLSMSRQVFLKTIPFIAHQDEVDLTPAIGDPLIDHDLEWKVDELAKHGIKAGFTCNAILLHRHMDWIIESRNIAGINFSIPGFNPSDYKEQYGVDKGEVVGKNILSFLAENTRRQHPIRIKIQVRNRHAPTLIKNHQSFISFKPFIKWPVTLEFTHEWENWSGDVQIEKWSPHMLKRQKLIHQIKKPCKNLRGGLINPDGTMRLCGCRVKQTDHDDMLIGTVDDSAEDLLRNAQYIRNGFYHGKFPNICNGCSFYHPEA